MSSGVTLKIVRSNSQFDFFARKPYSYRLF